jgi:hypothetical protein
VDITVSFTNCFTNCPAGNALEGAVLCFRDVDPDWHLSTPCDLERVSCAEAGCAGCRASHRRFTGKAHLTLKAHGSKDSLRWEMPEPAEVVS